MRQPHAHLAYAPRGAGLLYAVMWYAADRDVLGWFVGSRDGAVLASYFMLPGHYGGGATLLRSLEDDVRAQWIEVRADGDVPVSAPVPEAEQHELSRLQDRFVRHWLFFDDDADAAAEGAALNARDLAVRHVNVRAERLGKLRKAAAVWRYHSPGADVNVLLHLGRRWPLDYEAQA